MPRRRPPLAARPAQSRGPDPLIPPAGPPGQHRHRAHHPHRRPILHRLGLLPGPRPAPPSRLAGPGSRRGRGSGRRGLPAQNEAIARGGRLGVRPLEPRFEHDRGQGGVPRRLGPRHPGVRRHDRPRQRSPASRIGRSLAAPGLDDSRGEGETQRRRIHPASLFARRNPRNRKPSGRVCPARSNHPCRSPGT